MTESENVNKLFYETTFIIDLLKLTSMNLWYKSKTWSKEKIIRSLKILNSDS